MLTIPIEVIRATKSEVLATERERLDRWRQETVTFRNAGKITMEVLEDLQQAAEALGDTYVYRAITAIIAMRGRDGEDRDLDRKIPNFAAAALMIRDYIATDAVDGWLYREEQDGHRHAYLVTDVKHEFAATREDHDYVSLTLVANGSNSSLGLSKQVVTWDRNEVTNKTVWELLQDRGLFWERPEFKAEYDAITERYQKVLTTGFAKQYRLNGVPLSGADRWERRHERREGVKVVHDIAPSEIKPFAFEAPTTILPGGSGKVPIRPVLQVYDLSVHKFWWVNVEDLKEYEYDKTLGSKIVLSEDHRDLLDILTTDIDNFTGDVIEGKSAGNVILCKGIPGVGKTLTAEIYSELIERPLYSIHSGTLGVTPGEIRERLETVFKRAKRWDAVLLLDEADVFVIQRRNNIQQNAIVAEFLRTLEYFDGLFFMTTNRPDDIDDAIISRCAAVIEYTIPSPENSARVWRIQADNNNIDLSDDLIKELVTVFNRAAPRDIKMLLRLAARVAKKKEGPLSMDLFRRCAMFRGVNMSSGGAE